MNNFAKIKEFKDFFNEKFLLDNKDIFIEKGKEIDGLLSDGEMSIICGDFYGIQKFIFDGLTTSKAAKILRAKSAFVEIFTKIIARHICKKFNIEEDRILSENAGKFEILAHFKIDENKLEEIQKEINEYFIKNFYGIAGMSVIYENCTSGDFTNPSKYKELRDKITDKIEAKKMNKFSLYARENPVLESTKDITNETLCRFCNMRKITKDDKCDICDTFVKLGSWLVSNKDTINTQELNISFCGDITLKLDNKIKSYVLKEDYKIVDFEKLASNSLNALGILKADVDGMGNFIKDEKEKSGVCDCFCNFDCFSKNIDAFFSLYIPKIIEKSFKNSYVVFAGGDDLFILGEWESALNLAREIRKEFKNFVKEETNLSISFGIAIAKHNTPISYLANITESLLESSKDFKGKNNKEELKEKDAISMFNKTANWDLYLETYEALKNKLSSDTLSEDDKTAFFYRLLDFCDMSERLKGDEFSPKDALWKSKLNYSFNRNIKGEHNELLSTLNKQIEKHPKESKMVISEIIYKRREK